MSSSKWLSYAGRLEYSRGKQSEFLVKKLLKKIQRNLTHAVKFVVIYDTKKVSYFLPKKDKIPN